MSATKTDKGPKEVESSGFYSGGFREGKDGDLQFVRKDKGRFNMQELLKASAQVLANGSLGSSYKAVVSSGATFSVKRLKRMNNGSLASHLHAKRATGEPSLDWPTWLKIIRGVARGLTYLYSEFSKEMIPLGHLKSSNVLLDQKFEPMLTEYGLVPEQEPCQSTLDSLQVSRND